MPGGAGKSIYEDLSMQNEIINQYSHTWRVFVRLVKDFDDESWLHTGRKAMTPARLSFHMLKSTKYYISDQTEIHFASGKAFDVNCSAVEESDLPSRNDVIACIDYFSNKTTQWLAEIDFSSPNEAFPWAGKTKAGVVLFMLRHFLYHLGELSCLLNESLNGEAEDNYVKAL